MSKAKKVATRAMSKAKKVAETLATVGHAMPAGGSIDIPLPLIKVDGDFNIRQKDEEATKALSVSMHKEGQIQDVIVEPNGDGTYTLRAGHRRREAALLLGWESIRAMVWVPTDRKGEPVTDRSRRCTSPACRLCQILEYDESKKGG